MKNMNNENKDLRFLRTEKALIEAIKNLLAEKGFDDITISDICLEAAVSRTAFYQHFEDKYALVMAWIIADIKPPAKLFVDDTLTEYFNQLLDAEYAYRAQMNHLVHPDGNKELQWRISAMWSDGFLQYYKNKYLNGARFEIPYEMMAVYNCSGVIGLIWQNILNGFSLPKDILVTYIVRKIQQSNNFIHL